MDASQPVDPRRQNPGMALQQASNLNPARAQPIMANLSGGEEGQQGDQPREKRETDASQSCGDRGRRSLPVTLLPGFARLIELKTAMGRDV